LQRNRLGILHLCHVLDFSLGMDFVKRLRTSARLYLPRRYAALLYCGVSFTDACGK
jgi:hypothetical protein